MLGIARSSGWFQAGYFLILCWGAKGSGAGRLRYALAKRFEIPCPCESRNDTITHTRPSLVPWAQMPVAAAAQDQLMPVARAGPSAAAPIATYSMCKDRTARKMSTGRGTIANWPTASATGASLVQAALTSAATFAVEAILPLRAVTLTPVSYATPAVAAVAIALLVSLMLFGAISARASGADTIRGAARMTNWA